jgi:hypothetical protein
MSRAALAAPDRPRDTDLATAVEEWQQSGRPLSIERLARAAHVRYATARAYLIRHNIIEGEDPSDERAKTVAANPRPCGAAHGQASNRQGLSNPAEIRRRAEFIRSAKVAWVRKHGLDKRWLEQLRSLPLD